jgi:hypothetical protein
MDISKNLVLAILSYVADKLKLSLAAIKELFITVILNEYLSDGQCFDMIKPYLPSIRAKASNLKDVMAALGLSNYAILVGDTVFISTGDSNQSESPCTLQIEKGVTTIRSWMIQPFRSSLCEVIIPNTVTQIDHEAFQYSSIRSLVFPAGMKEIPLGVCRSCDNLESVTLPKGLTKISFGAFSYCKKLNDIRIPDSVTTIEGDAFYKCDSLPDKTRKRILEIGGDEAFDWKPTVTPSKSE